MKTQKKLFQRTGRVILTLFLLSAIIFACNDEIVETENWQQERSEMQLKSKVIREGTVQLEGFTRFAFYVKNERYYITDGYTSNFLKCEATLTFNGGQGSLLTVIQVIYNRCLNFLNIALF